MRWLLAILTILNISYVHSNQNEGISQLADLLANPTPSISILEGEPSADILGCVNTLTGDFYLMEVDLALSGHSALTLGRTYTSSDHRGGSLGHCWFHNHMQVLCKHFQHEWKDTVVIDNGSKMLFTDLDGVYPNRKVPSIPIDKFSLFNKVTNTSTGKISGRTNIQNHRLEYDKKLRKCTLVTGSGCRQLYTDPQNKHFYPILKLVHVQKPDGNHVEYLYGKKEWQKIQSKNKEGTLTGFLLFPENKSPSEIKLDPTYVIESHDGRKVQYEFKRYSKNKYHHLQSDRFLLTKVSAPHSPTVIYEYEDPTSHSLDLLIAKRYPENRYLLIEYYKLNNEYNINGRAIKVKTKSDQQNKVYQLKAPVGCDSTPISIYTFDYSIKWNKQYDIKTISTSVFDAYHHLVTYTSYGDDRLAAISKYKGTENHQLFSKERLYWGYNRHYTFLHTRSLEDALGHVLYARSYEYDDKGNVLVDIQLGNFTGKAAGKIELNYFGDIVFCTTDRYQRSYTYSKDDFNLLTYAEEQNVDSHVGCNIQMDPKSSLSILLKEN